MAHAISRMGPRTDPKNIYSPTSVGSAELVSWCFEPSQPQTITSGLNTNFNLSPSYSLHKSLYHKSSFFFFFFFISLSNHTSNSIHNFGTQNQKNKHMFWSLYIFREHSTRGPASSGVTYFILQAYTGTGVSHS